MAKRHDRDLDLWIPVFFLVVLIMVLLWDILSHW